MLQQRGPWGERDRIVGGTLKHLNDYVGHRPIAVLENRRKAIYDHEFGRCRCTSRAQVGWGPYRLLIEKTLEILQAADADLLREACYDPEQLEFALDPRATISTTADKRPKLSAFGEWDPEHIDSKDTTHASSFARHSRRANAASQPSGSLNPELLLKPPQFWPERSLWGQGRADGANA